MCPSSACWQQHLLFLPWIFSGLSIMKLPFHTTEKSTGSSLIFIPSYIYWRPKNGGEKKTKRRGESGSETKNIEEEFEFPWALVEAAPCYPEVSSSEPTKWGATRNWTAEQKLELPSRPWETLSLTTSCALNSSLAFIVHGCVCRERERENVYVCGC